jgi:hypothetical protein
MEPERIWKAKAEARRRGKSVSQMVADYFDSLGAQPLEPAALPPATAALVGILKGHPVSDEDYRRHLREKHL